MQSKKKLASAAFRPLDRHNDRYILLVLWLTTAPHFWYLPLYLSLLLLSILLLWSVCVFITGSMQRLQNKWLQFSVLALGIALILSAYRSLLGVESGCAVLVLMLFAKAFEVKNYRDAIVVYNLALFVIASLFLYGQQIIFACIGLVSILCCLYAMFQLQHHNNAYQELKPSSNDARSIRKQAIKTIALLMLLATPLFALLFFFMPRIAPLWSVPSSSSQSTTGLSDVINPGDIAELSRSNELAFRVIFANPRQKPAQQQLYWRAMVLDHFDGISWRRSNQLLYRINQHNQASLGRIFNSDAMPSPPQLFNYRLILEPSKQTWFPSLEYSLSHPPQPLFLQSDLSLSLNYPNSQRASYELQWISPTPHTELNLYPTKMLINQQLPFQLNPRTKQLASQLLLQANNNPKQYMQLVLSWMGAQNFIYTLSPPLLTGEHRIDDFLFNTRAGFCEHYASAFVNLMRMAAIPARIVVGYQGGREAIDQKSWEVRQLDAHAWTEVWFENQGWVRVDPTTVAASTRISEGMQQYAQQNTQIYGDTFYGRLSASHGRWLTELQIMTDYLNYQWQSNIIGFDQVRQKNILKRWSINGLSTQLMMLATGIFLLLIFFGKMILRLQRNRISRLDLALNRLSAALAKQQLARYDNEPVLSWLTRIEQQSEQTTMLKQIQQLYTEHVYIHPLKPAQQRQLHKLLRKYTNSVGG